MYYYPEPPLGLLLIGFLIGVTCGFAFDATLKLQVKQWQQEIKAGKPTDLSQMSRFFLPFLGICFGICLFLTAGLEIFVYSRAISLTLAGPFTLLIAGLVWGQLKKLIIQLLEGGSEALDLDAFY
jgi:hypothetical protein